MRIGFDIDDTIIRCPEFFAVASKALMAAGHKVYIVSYREDRGFAEEDLAEHCVSFDELVLPTEEELRRGEPADSSQRGPLEGRGLPPAAHRCALRRHARGDRRFARGHGGLHGRRSLAGTGQVRGE